MRSKSSPHGCSTKKMFLKFCKINRKTPVPDSLFNKALACNFIKKESLAKVFSYGFCEFIKDTLFSEHLQATAFGDQAET